MLSLRPLLAPHGGSLDRLRTARGAGWPASARSLAGWLPDPFCEFAGPPAASSGGGGVTPLSYALKGASRGKSQLTASVSATGVNGVADMTLTIKEAIATWEAAVQPNLSISVVGADAGADIRIGVNDLGAPDPKTGRVRLGCTTADGTVIQFNSNPKVKFVQRSPGGTSLLAVATHEIGHALGLLHATTASSVMFPRTAATESLSSDDVAAIRALYGWSGQRRLQGGTNRAPAICGCGGTLALAWRGAGDDEGIWLATSTDGSAWSTQRSIPAAATADGPALAWDGKQLWMAWRGVEGDEGLYYATTTDFFTDTADNQNWSGVRHAGEGASSHGPRIAVVGPTPIMVWKGIAGDTAIYFSTFAGQWLPQNRIGGVGTVASPAVCQDISGVPRMVWRGVEGDQALYTSTLEGAPGSVLFWQPQQLVAWVVPGNGLSGTEATMIAESLAGPSVTSSPARIFAAWRGVDGDQALWFTQLAMDSLGARSVPEWSSQAVVPGVSSSHGPSIARFDGKIHLFWKGSDDDAGIYTASL